jgi:hypothetical protein
MSKKLLLKSEASSYSPPLQSEIADINDNKNIEIENETECPRCHDIMTLSSEFDRLCYFCDECSFSLQNQ